MSAGTSISARSKIFLIFFAFILGQQSSAESATLRGRIYLAQDQIGKQIEVVLKKGRRVVARVVPDNANNYEFRDLANGRYELRIKLEKREVKRRVDLCCGPDSISVIDVNLDRNDINITIRLPIEDPHIVDIVELRRDYPEDILNEYEKARRDTEKGNFGQAAERLLRVLKSAPGFYAARARLGMVYQAMACYPEAEKEYLRARKINPKAAQPMVNLGGLYIGAADARLDDGRRYLDEAVAILKEAIVLKPTSSIAHLLLGSAYFKARSFETAEESINKAIALGVESRFPEARLMLANLCIQQKRWQDAIDHLDIYLRENRYGSDRGKIKDMRKEIRENLKPAD